MMTRWFQHIRDHEEQMSFKQTVRGCSFALDRLVEILKEDEEHLIKRLSEESYEKPSWSEYQADLLGQLRTTRRLKDLVNLKENTNVR